MKCEVWSVKEEEVWSVNVKEERIHYLRSTGQVLQTVYLRELHHRPFYTVCWNTRIRGYCAHVIRNWRSNHPHRAFITNGLLRHNDTGLTSKTFWSTIYHRNSYTLIPRKANKKWIHPSTNVYGIKTRDDNIEVPIKAFWLFFNVCFIAKGKDCKNNYRWLANGVTWHPATLLLMNSAATVALGLPTSADLVKKKK